MSSYRLIEFSDGFRIEHAKRATITVRLEPWALHASGGACSPLRLGLFQGHRLIANVVDRLAGSWTRTPARADSAQRQERVFRRIAAQALAGRIAEQRRRLVARAPAVVQDVQRSIFAATFQSACIAETEEFYRERYLAADVVRFRAAAIAVAHLEELWPANRRPAYGASGMAFPADVFAVLGNWRGLFSPDGRPYRSLNRTLTDLPAVRPAGVLCNLRKVRLEAPVRDRLALIAACARISAHSPERNATSEMNQVRILQRATDAQIRQALVRIGTATGRRLTVRRMRDIGFAVDYLADFEEVHGGGLGGLVDKAIRWHLQVAQMGLEDVLAGIDVPEGMRVVDAQTKQPPIPLPRAKGIRFLSTVGQVVEEGQAMGHCIGFHARLAVAGWSYLFHVDHAGEAASIEVGADGTVRQAAGPYNSHNDAVQWGVGQLSKWSRGLACAA